MLSKRRGTVNSNNYLSNKKNFFLQRPHILPIEKVL